MCRAGSGAPGGAQMGGRRHCGACSPFFSLAGQGGSGVDEAGGSVAEKADGGGERECSKGTQGGAGSRIEAGG